MGTSTLKADLRAYSLLSTPYSLVVFLLPFYILELGGGELEIGLAFSMYALAVVVTRPVAGAFADLLGRRLTNMAGAAVLVVAMVLLGCSSQILQIYVALFLTGVASSLINVATIAYISDIGGLENPELYSKMRIAAAVGAVGGGVFIPITYFLDKLWGYAPAFKTSALALAAISAASLLLLPSETVHLAARHKEENIRVAGCIIAVAFFLGLATGLYGPRILPYLHSRFSLSPFSAILVYLPAVFSWLYGPRLAKPEASILLVGGFLMAIALIGMATAQSPVVFSLWWVLESLGTAVASTSLDQLLSRYVAGAYWGRGYGTYQAVNNLGYAMGAAASGVLANPFFSAVAPLVVVILLAAICLKVR
ncbi:MAG: MFS transporter [Pyrobaculum sp.]